MPREVTGKESCRAYAIALLLPLCDPPRGIRGKKKSTTSSSFSLQDAPMSDG